MRKFIVGVFILSIAISAKSFAHDLACEVKVNGQANLILSALDFRDSALITGIDSAVRGPVEPLWSEDFS